MAGRGPSRSDGVVEIRTRAIWRALGLVVIIAALAGAAVLIQQRERFFPSAAAQIDRSGYQAVFLVTNQVYFGRLEIVGDDYLLSEVFYLNQPESGAPSQLVKRGGEPHGPRDPMIIPARSVLFIENLRDDSPVVNGIKAFKAGQTSAPATAAPTARPSATR